MLFLFVFFLSLRLLYLLKVEKKHKNNAIVVREEPTILI